LEHAWARVSLSEDGIDPVGPALFKQNITSASSIGPHIAVLDGTVTMDLDSNGGLEVEFPYYSANLYNFSFARNGVGDNPSQTVLEKLNRSYVASVVTSGKEVVHTYGAIVDFAVAEDFTLLRYQGAPIFTRTT